MKYRHRIAMRVACGLGVVGVLTANNLEAQQATFGVVAAAGITTGELGYGTATGGVSLRTASGWDVAFGVVSYLGGNWLADVDTAPTVQVRTPLVLGDRVYLIAAPSLHWGAAYRSISAGIGHPLRQHGLALEGTVQHGSSVNTFELTLRKRW